MWKKWTSDQQTQKNHIGHFIDREGENMAINYPKPTPEQTEE